MGNSSVLPAFSSSEKMGECQDKVLAVARENQLLNINISWAAPKIIYRAYCFVFLLKHQSASQKKKNTKKGNYRSHQERNMKTLEPESVCSDPLVPTS